MVGSKKSKVLESILVFIQRSMTAIGRQAHHFQSKKLLKNKNQTKKKPKNYKHTHTRNVKFLYLDKCYLIIYFSWFADINSCCAIVMFHLKKIKSLSLRAQASLQLDREQHRMRFVFERIFVCVFFSPVRTEFIEFVYGIAEAINM